MISFMKEVAHSFTRQGEKKKEKKLKKKTTAQKFLHPAFYQ